MAISQDLTEIYIQFQQDYRNVFLCKLGDQVFIYRSLTRKEYNLLAENEDFNDFQKEELLCQTCTLWPKQFDFENCDEGGLPSLLSREILQKSLFDDPQSFKKVLNFYRNELNELENQVTCMINEAFPEHDIEEIENWDIEKTAKYLSRAEWKLFHLRGIPFVAQQQSPAPLPFQSNQPVTTEISSKSEATIRGGKKEALTPEKLRELKQKFPGIRWEEDAIMQSGIDGILDQESISTVAPAMRVPGE